ncbi:hypothetical protein H8B09_13535 [Paenibacillus sp. PR3]|uniref:Uncharacterized protein n=1 Tax=Paenibacillus terricola TaxID=2763503 RepID=A0ABR8MW29_9BACL|nr:hypothetical protein [Paenibacillus terricola]MBD3919780.1 hypothetical protein [Paenibacillus terricola]
MQLLPYYRNEFIASSLKNETGWTEALFNNNVSLWQREKERFHELFRIIDGEQQLILEYSVIIPLAFVRTGRIIEQGPGVGTTANGVTCQYDDAQMLMTYSMTDQQMNGSVARFLFKARSEIAQLIDFSGSEARWKEIVG